MKILASLSMMASAGVDSPEARLFAAKDNLQGGWGRYAQALRHAWREAQGKAWSRIFHAISCSVSGWMAV